MNEQKVFSRAKHCVCKQCGTRLEAKRMVYNKYGGSGMELYCPNCRKIEYGTEPEIYRLAQDFVDEVEFDYFVEMEEGIRRDRLNVAKVCEILNWIYKKTGVLTSAGLRRDAVNNFDYEDE